MTKNADNDWAIDTGELRSQSESLYDERGQVYQTWQTKGTSHICRQFLGRRVR